ncbi:MAG: beta-galactosidase trimerization domain-containing protein, partial [Kiritimatiellia bacterium]|nr:beta-galactosidase trimerization domain-containing protein [Kiritimatiellia bacterium]
MRKRFVLIGLLIAGVLNSAPSWGAGQGAIVARKAGSPPAIDGNPDEECWQKAEKYPLRHWDFEDLKVGGQAAFCYDDKYLYAALWLDEPEPAGIKAPKAEVNAPQIWTGEVVEWFIRPSEEKADYVQLAWNPSGSQFNQRCRAAGSGSFDSDRSWRPGWKCAGRVGEKGWTAEASIPLSELGVGTPAEGSFIRMNLCRTRQIGGLEYSAVAQTGSGGFHQPDRFARVWFGKYSETKVVVDRSGPLTALVGCRGSHYFGYDAPTESRAQLDRMLGESNVVTRVEDIYGTMQGWPRNYRELAGFHLVVLVNVPAKSLAPEQIQDLCQYVEDGGQVILMGPMIGWKHNAKNSWMKSPFMALMPLEPSAEPDAKGMQKGRLELTDKNHALFRNIPLADLPLTNQSYIAKPAPGAEIIAVLASSKGATNQVVPFIAEKRTGKGRVIHINYAASGKLGSMDYSIFVSPYYPMFWDNLVEYAASRKVPHPCAMVKAPEITKGAALVFDLLKDNCGDIFKPGGTIRILPQMEGETNYPYLLETWLEGPELGPYKAGVYPLEGPGREIKIPLPRLDRGAYLLRVEAKKGDALRATARQPFSVALPRIAEDDAFPFMIFWEGDFLSETDTRRMAANLKAIGFTAAGWLGEIIERDYQNSYRLYNRYRFASRLQEAGLNVRPVWYPVGYEIQTLTNPPPGAVDRFSGLPKPDPVLPGTDLLPWFSFWMRMFDDKIFGRMPLTDGYAAYDETCARSIPISTNLVKSYGRLHPIAETGKPGYFDFLNWYFRITADFGWFARSICETYNPGWAHQNIIMPSSMLGKGGAIVDWPNTASAFGWISPDVYHYGEAKLYHKSLWSMAVMWSATDFGRLARAGFTGGQLNNDYYETFPEQVFAALSGGATFFHVFSMPTVCIETHGRLDERFAEISRRTTRDAGRIGRTLNHCERSRARVALVYPHTAHVWDSMAGYSPDCLEGGDLSSNSYLQRMYAMKTAFHLLREMAGQVDILFDSQIRRGDLKNYDVCVLACAPQTEEATLRELRRFTESGGLLLVTTDSGRLNENNRPTGALYDVLPAEIAEERPVSADYSDTRMSKPEQFSIGNNLSPKKNAEVLFKFADGKAACVRGGVGRGEAVVLGIPLGALRAGTNEPKRKVIEYLIERRAALLSRPADREFSAITFVPRRGEGRIFMVVNHRKDDARTVVKARGNEHEANWTLADIVTGEKIPFTVKDGVLSFEISCPRQWGRALALLDKAPAQVETSVSGPVAAG